jgi:hypothetical protein
MAIVQPQEGAVSLYIKESGDQDGSKASILLTSQQIPALAAATTAETGGEASAAEGGEGQDGYASQLVVVGGCAQTGPSKMKGGRRRKVKNADVALEVTDLYLLGVALPQERLSALSVALKNFMAY